MDLVQALAAKLPSSDGGPVKLIDLARTGPLFVYGIKNGCPVNHEAQRHFDALARAYGAKVQFVGLSNHAPGQFEPWAATYQPGYRVAFDPSREVIRALGIASSPWLIQVEADGRVSASWPGFGRPALAAANVALALAAGQTPAPLPFPGAPEKNRYG